MADAPPISTVIGLPPDETVRAFEARDELRATVRWSEMWHQDHARAFTVAKVAKLDLLAEIQASLADVIANGGTFEQWQRNLVPYLQKQGWWGDVVDRDLTGTDDLVKVGPRRLRTIYDTNLRVSRAAGRWARIQELKGSRPFLRYTAVLDARTRPEHRAWHGIILPVDHEWWNTHFPPCGWFCRCTVRQLSQRELDAKGWKVSPIPDDGPPREFYPAGRITPELVPAGISPGFAYNPGKASMRAIANRLLASLERTAAQDNSRALAEIEQHTLSDAFLETLNEPGAAVPVMAIDETLRRALGSEARIVRLSSDTYAKQQGRTSRSAGHPELTIEDYRLLPRLGATPDVVLQEDDSRLLLMKVAGDRWRVVSLKTTIDGQELYLLSYRWATSRDVRRLRAKWPEIKR